MPGHTTLDDLARDRTRCDTWSAAALTGLVLISIIPDLAPTLIAPLPRVLIIAACTLTIVMFTTRTTMEAIAAARTHEPLGRELAASIRRSAAAFTILTSATLALHMNHTTTGWLWVIAAALVAGALITFELFSRPTQHQPVRDRTTSTHETPQEQRNLR